MRFNTPLRYPGGKGKLSDFVKLIILENKLLDGHYVEPYAGGAGIAFSLLFEEYVSSIHINDLNKSVYSFWHAVLFETEALCNLIQNTHVDMKEWLRQKSIQDCPSRFTSLEVGFSTFFLNRTNRSGIIKGGVIGGKEQNGFWKLDARYNKEDLISRIKKIAKYRDRIYLYNLDAAKFIKNILPQLPDKTLINFDPPYYVKGKGLYENYYIHQDHELIARLISDIKRQNWIVSYDNVSEIRELYEDYRHIIYGLNYSASVRYRGSEVMFFCEKLVIPEVENPTKVLLDSANFFNF